MTKRKRRRSWGSITTITKTKHVLRWPENTLEGRKRPSKTFYGTYKEANLWLDMKHAELEQNNKNTPVQTVNKVYETWYLPYLEQRLLEGGLSKNTYNSFTRIYKRDIAPTWASIMVTEIKSLKVQEWLETMTKNIAKTALSIFKAIIDFAVTYDLVEENVLRRKYIMPTKTTELSQDTYSLEDATKMLENIRGQLFEAAYIVITFGGARMGESLAVSKDDLSIIEVLGQKFVRIPIDKQIGRKDNEIQTRLKNKQSYRDTLVPWNYGGSRLFEIAESAPTEWLNDNCSGVPMGQTKLKGLWEKSAKDNYIPFRNLRNSWRTFASYEWGVEGETLELLMGHKLPGMSGAHYIRPSIQDLARMFAEALNRFESI